MKKYRCKICDRTFTKAEGKGSIKTHCAAHKAQAHPNRKKNSGKTITDKVKSKKGGRFECPCGYHTCDGFYKTERKLERHQAGVLAAKKKKIFAEASARDKPITPEQQPITEDEENPRKVAPEKAHMTGRLAVKATKLRILEIDNKNDAPLSQFVEFEGREGGESNGIVDLLAVKRNRDRKKIKNMDCNVNDLLDIIHIQVKGGDSPPPTPDDKRRMKIVSKYYKCRETLLSEWNPARYNVVKFSRLNPQNEWDRVDERTIFGK